MRGTRVRATRAGGQQKFRLIEGILTFAGIGDALGVDWQGLIAETRQQASDYAALQGRDRDTSAKQRWQPHRVLLDMGISFAMAGTEYAQRVLAEAREQLLQEREKERQLLLLQEQQKEEQLREQLLLQQQQQQQLLQEQQQSELQEEQTELQTEQLQLQQSPPPPPPPLPQLAPAKPEAERQEHKVHVVKPLPAHDYKELFDSEHLEPLACAQLGMRTRAIDRQRMVGNVCGPGSRALCARQDLRLRRQLCGLPARENDLPRTVPTVSEGLRSLAMHMFQRTMDVK